MELDSKGNELTVRCQVVVEPEVRQWRGLGYQGSGTLMGFEGDAAIVNFGSGNVKPVSRDQVIRADCW